MATAAIPASSLFPLIVVDLPCGSLAYSGSVACGSSLWQPPRAAVPAKKVQRLLFRVVGYRVASELASESRLLVAAEGQLARAVHEGAHPHRAGLDAMTHLDAGVEVA